jgi:hypothetical protein
MRQNIDEVTYIDQPNELDLTHQHEVIVSGIQKLKQLYKLSYSQSRSLIEAAYLERIEKIPQFLTVYQDLLTNNKRFLLYLERSSAKTKLTFNLLKCNFPSGFGTIQLEGFKLQHSLSINEPSTVISQNGVKEYSCRVVEEKGEESCTFDVKIFEKLEKLPAEQIAFCKSITVFENHKDEVVDCCFYINLEMSAKDRVELLKFKFKGIEGILEKLSTQGFARIRNEFKPTCCECFIF